MLNECGSTSILIYQKKQDITFVTSYRGTKFMSYTIKSREKVIEQRLRKETQVTYNQFGFMSIGSQRWKQSTYYNVSWNDVRWITKTCT
jgi:hypothetical protein